MPIINFRLLWKIDDKFGLLLEGDVLAATQGRAEDVLIAATYKLSDSFGIRAGYRILEGGADNDEVYNFALLNYSSVRITYTFKISILRYHTRHITTFNTNQEKTGPRCSCLAWKVLLLLIPSCV